MSATLQLDTSGGAGSLPTPAVSPSLGPSIRPWLLLGPALAFLAIFFAAPSVLLLSASFHEADSFGNPLPALSLAQYLSIFTTPYLNSSLLATAAMSLEVSVLCIVLGYPVAHSLVHAKSPTLRAILYGIVVSPLLTSVIVRTYGWVVMLAADGPINQLIVRSGLSPTPVKLLYTYPATLISVTHVLLPFSILPLAAALSQIGPELSRAAAILGATRSQIFWHITLPLSAQGVLTGALLAFTVAMGTYITPLLVGGSTQPLASIRVYVLAETLFNIPAGAALSVAMLVLTVAVSAAVIVAFRTWEVRTFGPAA